MSWICTPCGTENPSDAMECSCCHRVRSVQMNDESSENDSREQRKTIVRTAGINQLEPGLTRKGSANQRQNAPRETIVSHSTHLDQREEKRVERQPTVRGGIGFHKAVAPSIPKCSLTLIPEEGEDVKSMKHDYEGETVILNRGNTEPTNRTITSKEHAVLTYKEGGWFIEDKSTFETTFIKVMGKKELQDGDVIALGDRRFIFKVES